MEITRSGSGAERARWLAELALALEQAEQAAKGLGITAPASEELRQLRDRIELVREEVEDLRRGNWRAPVQELGSKWIRL
jgi:hypothetical protein